jgi:hypothetical protein
MNGRGPLVAVSAAQLAAGLAGLVVALRRRRAYDVWLPSGLDAPFRAGAPEHVVRDAVWAGTAYSAPVPMLLAQGWSLGRLTARPDQRAARDLAVLGSLMVPGYLVERWGRTSLRRWDPVETPVVAVSLGLAAAMVPLGMRAARGSVPRIRGTRRS